MSYHLIRISQEKIPVFKWATTNPTDKEASSTSFGQPRGGARPKGGGRPISFHSMDRNQLQSLASGSDSIQVGRETKLIWVGREDGGCSLARWLQVENADWLNCRGRRMLISSFAEVENAGWLICRGGGCWLARLLRAEDANWLVCHRQRMLIGSFTGGGWCWLARLPGRRMLIGWLEEVVNYDWRI